MLRTNQTYISLEKNNNEPPGFGVTKAVGGVSVQAHAKAAFLSRSSQLLVTSSSMLFFTTKGSARM